MALFAGDAPIMTGDELTYDYNFDPFSAKNVQECRCGSENCRGVLGPKPKDHKIVKDTIKEVVKAGVRAGKRKLKELLGDDEVEEDDKGSRSPKKRKIKEAKGVKKSPSSAKMRTVKDAAKTIRKGVSAQLFKARQAISSGRKELEGKKIVKAKSLKTYGTNQTKLSLTSSRFAIVGGDDSPGSVERKKVGGPRKSIAKNAVRRVREGKLNQGTRASRSEGTIRVIGAAEEEREESSQ